MKGDPGSPLFFVNQYIAGRVRMKLPLSIAALLIVAGALLYFSPAQNQMLFVAVNSLLPISSLWIAITTLGDGAVAGCIFYLLCRKNNDVLAKGLIAAAAGLAASDGLKRLFGIARPEHAADFGSNFHLLAESMAVTSFSMPSGHTIAAFLLGTLLFKYLNLHVAGKIVLGVILLAVGVSRIALGVHWPADVLVGAGLGIFIGIACIALPIKIKYKWGGVVVHLLYLIFVVALIHKYFL